MATCTASKSRMILGECEEGGLFVFQIYSMQFSIDTVSYFLRIRSMIRSIYPPYSPHISFMHAFL